MAGDRNECGYQCKREYKQRDIQARYGRNYFIAGVDGIERRTA